MRSGCQVDGSGGSAAAACPSMVQTCGGCFAKPSPFPPVLVLRTRAPPPPRSFSHPRPPPPRIESVKLKALKALSSCFDSLGSFLPSPPLPSCYSSLLLDAMMMPCHVMSRPVEAHGGGDQGGLELPGERLTDRLNSLSVGPDSCSLDLVSYLISHDSAVCHEPW